MLVNQSVFIDILSQLTFPSQVAAKSTNMTLHPFMCLFSFMLQQFLLTLLHPDMTDIEE